MKHVEQLISLDACPSAIEWAKTQPDWDSCWANCPRGDWLLWVPGLDHKKMVLAACECARTALHLVPEGEERPRIAIETTEAWVRGEATLEEVRVAANAARASARAAERAAAWASKAAWASASAWASDAAKESAWASDAAAEAAAEAAWAVGGDANLACANIVRSHFPDAPELGGQS